MHPSTFSSIYNNCIDLVHIHQFPLFRSFDFSVWVRTLKLVMKQQITWLHIYDLKLWVALQLLWTGLSLATRCTIGTKTYYLIPKKSEHIYPLWKNVQTQFILILFFKHCNAPFCLIITALAALELKTNYLFPV